MRARQSRLAALPRRLPAALRGAACRAVSAARPSGPPATAERAERPERLGQPSADRRLADRRAPGRTEADQVRQLAHRLAGRPSAREPRRARARTGSRRRAAAGRRRAASSSRGCAVVQQIALEDALDQQRVVLRVLAAALGGRDAAGRSASAAGSAGKRGGELARPPRRPARAAARAPSSPATPALTRPAPRTPRRPPRACGRSHRRRGQATETRPRTATAAGRSRARASPREEAREGVARRPLARSVVVAHRPLARRTPSAGRRRTATWTATPAAAAACRQAGGEPLGGALEALVGVGVEAAPASRGPAAVASGLPDSVPAW